MDKITISDSLKPCLGKRLISAKRRLYELEGGSVSELDSAEVVLDFDAPEAIRYFSWEQANDEFKLSVRHISHLIDEPRPEIQAEDDPILLKLLGKNLTLFELYEDEFGNVVAVLLLFEIESFVIAVGFDEWNVEEQKSNFRFFSGDDLFLWTTEEFAEALKKHNLVVKVREETKSFVR